MAVVDWAVVLWPLTSLLYCFLLQTRKPSQLKIYCVVTQHRNKQIIWRQTEDDNSSYDYHETCRICFSGFFKRGFISGTEKKVEKSERRGQRESLKGSVGFFAALHSPLNWPFSVNDTSITDQLSWCLAQCRTVSSVVPWFNFCPLLDLNPPVNMMH